MRKLTHKEFIKKYRDRFNKNIKIIGKYNGFNNKIECHCLICNKNYFARADVLIQGCGHRDCYKPALNPDNVRKQTEAKENFLSKLNAINDSIIVLEEYKNCEIKLKCKCKVCGNEWSASPNKLLNGRGCPKCGIKTASKKRTMPKENFVDELALVNPNIKLIGEYINRRIKTTFICLIDNYEWDVAPSTLLQGHGCPKCSKNKRIKSHEEFLNKLKVKNNHNIKPISKYKGVTNDITIKCNDCNEIYVTIPHNLYHNVGCPNCSLTLGEKRIKDYLTDNNICFKIHKEFNNLFGVNGGLLSYDFYLPNYNLLIEYQGEFHDGTARQQTPEQFEIQQEHDMRKSKYASNNNIKLLEIWYWDYDNIEKILNNEISY